MSYLSISVEEYTTPNPITASEDTMVDDLADIMSENGIRHLPIVKNNKVVGIVSDRDVKLTKGLTSKEKRLVRAADIMALDPITVSCETSLDEVAFEMSQNKIGSVIVNDENDQLLGIFTVTDALNALIEIARTGHEEED